jgi:hypothetical protein
MCSCSAWSGDQDIGDIDPARTEVQAKEARRAVVIGASFPIFRDRQNLLAELKMEQANA